MSGHLALRLAGGHEVAALDPRTMTDLELRDADVLVVGGGLAALRAAVEAADGTRRVAVVVKRKLGRSGSSAGTTAGYSVAVEEPDQVDSWQAHVADTLRGGGGINDPRLVEHLCREAFDRLRELEHWETEFQREAGRYIGLASGDHSYPRVRIPRNNVGTDLTLPLRAEVERRGCTIIEDTTVVELVLHEGRVAGAICLKREPGSLVVVRARAVVLATGGAGRLFEVTSNPLDVTGDGYALAFRAGCALRDMEFIQFYPWRCIKPFEGARVAIQPSTFALGARLYNARGERFMCAYDALRCEATTRDLAAQGIYQQIRSGQDVEGGVLLDLSTLSDGAFERTNPKVCRALEARGLHYRSVRLVVAPEAHYFMGGISIGENGQSGVPGLFAAGETAGGVHGANRLDSNSLPDTQVFGRRAGRAAGRFSDAHGYVDLDPARIASWRERAGAANEAPASAADALSTLRTELRVAMWRAIGIVRSDAGLREGLAAVSAVRAGLRAVVPSGPKELETWVETENLCLVGELCCTAALHRTESRGAHYREDHLERDDKRWRLALELRPAPGGGIAVAGRPVHQPAVAPAVSIG